MNIYYRPYRPEGYTDDLGIISDRNQWIPEQPEGWYFWPELREWGQIRDWMEKHSIEWDICQSNVVIRKEKDAALFMMRWS
jgi:hypothetical protein